MSFSSFASNISTAKTSQTSYANLGNYTGAAGIGNLKLDNNLAEFWSRDPGIDYKQAFTTSTNGPTYGGDILNTPAQAADAKSFVFITAPSEVSYSQGAEVQQVSIFGANNPPVTVAGRNSGELQLGDALMEGFVLGKQVQQPILDLLQMQEVVLDASKGFINVPVYTVYAGQEVGSGRTYGNYVIENIDVAEEMRDLTGTTTRARVSVAFRQVPDYQINTGIDQAGSTSGGAKIKQTNFATDQAGGQDARARGANGGKNTGAGAGGANGTGGGDGGGGGEGGGGGGGGGGSTDTFNADRQARYRALRGREAKF